MVPGGTEKCRIDSIGQGNAAPIGKLNLWLIKGAWWQLRLIWQAACRGGFAGFERTGTGAV